MVRLRSPAPYGSVPERPKGADCKSVVSDFGGPNPPAPTKFQAKRLGIFLLGGKRGDSEARAHAVGALKTCRWHVFRALGLLCVCTVVGARGVFLSSHPLPPNSKPKGLEFFIRWEAGGFPISCVCRRGADRGTLNFILCDVNSSKF